MSVLGELARATGVSAAKDCRDRGLLTPPVIVTAPDSLTRALKVRLGARGADVDATALEMVVVKEEWEAGVAEEWFREVRN